MLVVDPVAAALVSAVSFGCADFLGGRVTRRLGAPIAVGIVQTVAALLVLVFVLAADRPFADGRNLWLGMAAGTADGFALMLLYWGFAEGRIGIVAPLSGLISVMLPALGEIVWVGRMPSHMQTTGIVLACVAVAILGLVPDRQPGKKPLAFSVLLGVAGGLLFGFTNLALGLIEHAQGDGAMLVVRTAAAAISIGSAIVYRAQLRPDGAALGLASLAGLLDAVGMAGFVFAATSGLIAVSSALLSLYGGVTTLLGVFVLKERVGRQQLIGLLLSAVSAVMLSLSTAASLP